MTEIGYYIYPNVPLKTKFEWVREAKGSAAVEQARGSIGNIGNAFGTSDQTITDLTKSVGASWTGQAATAAGQAMHKVADRSAVVCTTSGTGGGAVEGYGVSFDEMRPKVHWEDPGDYSNFEMGLDVVDVAANQSFLGDLFEVQSDHMAKVEQNLTLDSQANTALYGHEQSSRTALAAFPSVAPAAVIAPDAGGGGAGGIGSGGGVGAGGPMTSGGGGAAGGGSVHSLPAPAGGGYSPVGSTPVGYAPPATQVRPGGVPGNPVTGGSKAALPGTGPGSASSERTPQSTVPPATSKAGLSPWNTPAANTDTGFGTARAPGTGGYGSSAPGGYGRSAPGGHGVPGSPDGYGGAAGYGSTARGGPGYGGGYPPDGYGGTGGYRGTGTTGGYGQEATSSRGTRSSGSGGGGTRGSAFGERFATAEPTTGGQRPGTPGGTAGGGAGGRTGAAGMGGTPMMGGGAGSGGGTGTHRNKYWIPSSDPFDVLPPHTDAVIEGRDE